MYGQTINAGDVKDALHALESAVALERCAASIILLRSRSPEFSIATALDTLERECENNPPKVESFWLNWAVNFLPDEELNARESIRLFIYRSSFSEQVACRSNTMSILGRLAKGGDCIALAILKICVFSEEPKVRTNALSSLRMIESDVDSP